MILVNGQPMISYAVDQALKSRKAQSIYVSTDSEDIAAYVRLRGIRVIMRDESLGGDTPLLDVYRHALTQINDASIKFVVGLQIDHPDRNISVDEAISVFEAGGPECDMLYSVDAKGTKNGAHCIVSRHLIETGEYRKKIAIVDDCTNIHYPEDLKRAEANLRAREVNL